MERGCEKSLAESPRQKLTGYRSTKGTNKIALSALA